MSTELVNPPKAKPKARRKKPKAPGYVLDDKFFDSALKEGVREALMLPGNFPEKQVVRIKPGFGTACWSYQPPHNIFVGNKLFDKTSIRQGLTDAQQRKYVRNHYHHEKAHALYTERNMAKTKRWLEAIDCAFRLYNVFEDARIEHKYRVDTEYQFEWLTFETLPASKEPLGLLFSLIQAEGDKEAVQKMLESLDSTAADASAEKPVAEDGGITELLEGLVGVPSKEESQELFEKVFSYYEKIVAAKTSLSLFPLLKQWLDEFGKPLEQPEAGPTDLEMSAELMTDSDAADAFEAGTKLVDLVGKGLTENREALNPELPAAQRGNVLGTYEDPVDLGRAVALAKKFERIFQVQARNVRTAVPQKRMSTKHYYMGVPFYQHKELKAPRKKRLFVVVDCSGSMDGHHMDEGKIIVSALSILARKGLVTGQVVLSGIVSGAPCWERYEFPMAQSTINRIEGHAGGEGLEYSLRANLALAKAADYVFFYTDAQIGDAPISKSALHKQGIYTWGLYAGDSSDSFSKLIAHFDKAIMRTSAEALVDAMLVQLK